MGAGRLPEWRFADGNRSCLLGNTQPAPHGEIAFVLSDFGGGRSIIQLRDSTITWDASGGPITLRIDGNPSFTAQTETDTAHNLLVVPLANTPGPVMTQFLQQLANGHQLHVTTTVGTRIFDLSGSGPPFDAFGRCIVAMNAPRR
jgi:hypothetical protein